MYGVHPGDMLSMVGFCLPSYGVQLCVEGMASLSGLRGHSNHPKSFKVRLRRESCPEPQWSPGAKTELGAKFLCLGVPPLSGIPSGHVPGETVRTLRLL